MSKTIIEVRYPRAHGAIALRGSQPPLSWDGSRAPDSISGNVHVFELDVPDGRLLEFKPIRNEKDWSCERNYTLLAGERLLVEPYFDRTTLSLETDLRHLPAPALGRDVRFQIVLPPSYDEHDEKRYPVLYAQDGQALFTTGADPVDGTSWRLDTTVDELYEIGAIEEIIVVGLFTDQARFDLLSPVPDPQHGGGGAPRYLQFLVETLKPWVDRTYRTLPDAACTGLLGASMGGLFSFYAAWTRPDVFGKAACLSGSFWWSRRHMAKHVQAGPCPTPRPKLYLDSGAAKSHLDHDDNARDGLHHIVAFRRALVAHGYTPGDDLYTLAFPGQRHDNASWAARLAIPLQLLFPRRA